MARVILLIHSKMELRNVFAIILVVTFATKDQRYVQANSVRADVIEKYVMDQILEIVKSDKVIKQVVERVNQENQVDVAALNHDIAYKQQQFDEINTKLKNLVQTIEDNPDLTSALKPTIHQYETQLNDITNQMNQLKHQQNQEKPSYDTKQIAALLQRIFQNIEFMDKSQLKALYLTVIDRIDIRKDENHKNNSMSLSSSIMKLLNNFLIITSDEVLLSTSSLFASNTLLSNIISMYCPFVIQ